MEVNKPWKNNDVNKYYIISLDKETNEWKFFETIMGHTVFWKDEPSRYGMTKSKAIEVLNIVKNLTNEDVEPESNNETTEPTTPTEPSGDNETDPTTPTDTPTEPSESDTDPSTNTGGETSTRENESGETSSTSDTEPSTPTSPSIPTPQETPTEETQYKIITISSVTYNSDEIIVFDDSDYHKLKTTLTYIDTTYPNDNVHVVVAEENAGKSIFYFYLREELTWFLELKTNIDYSLVSNITTLDDIKELL